MDGIEWCRVVDFCECGNERSSDLLFRDTAFYYLPIFCCSK